MFDHLGDGFRRASESSLQMHQEFFRHWARLMHSTAPLGVGVVSDWTSPGYRRQWIDLGFDVLNKHRETLDAAYESGIQLIQRSFQVGQADSIDEQRKRSEELWRKLIDLQKTQAERTFQDVRTWFERSRGLVQDVRA
jgi:hypothetical protein